MPNNNKSQSVTLQSKEISFENNEHFTIVRADGTVQHCQIESVSLIQEVLGEVARGRRVIGLRREESDVFPNLARVALANNRSTHLSNVMTRLLSKISAEITARVRDFTRTARVVGLADLIIPSGISYWSQNDEYTSVIKIEEPMLHRVHFNGDFVHQIYVEARQQVPSRIKRSYTLLFPRLAYVYRENKYEARCDFQIFYLPAPFKSLDDIAYLPNLPNIEVDDGRICLNDFDPVGETIAERLESQIQDFWDSNFNSDLTGLFYAVTKECPELQTLAAWEETGKTNPAFITEIAFAEHLTSASLGIARLEPSESDLSLLSGAIEHRLLQMQGELSEALGTLLRDGKSPDEAIEAMAKEFSQRLLR